MTQDVQPLTWQKRTNIEEHMQFFSKINEIIDNLAPTVEEAEQAIAQATAAIASANDAIATANAASAAASAAASQAQTAASTVAGYDTRLTAAEGDIDAAEGDITALQGRMGTAEGNITALQGVQADYVKKTGAAQTVTSQIMVPTTATGVRDTQIANGTRIQNDLAAYEPMVRDTGNKIIAGTKYFTRIVAAVCSMGWNETSGNKPAGTYQMLLKIPKANITQVPIRGHFFVAVCIRGGASGVDIIDIGTNSGNITSIAMAMPRGLTHNVTYVVSDDADYWYFMRVNLGNSLDGVMAEIVGTMGVGFDASGFITPSDDERVMESVPGTEKGRVNNA